MRAKLVAGLCGFLLSLCLACAASAQAPADKKPFAALYERGAHREALAAIDALIANGEFVDIFGWLREAVAAGAPYPYAERTAQMLLRMFPEAQVMREVAVAHIIYAGTIALRESIVCTDRDLGERTLTEIEARHAEFLRAVRNWPVEAREAARQRSINMELEIQPKRKQAEMLCTARVPDPYWQPLETAARRAILIVPKRILALEQ